MVNDKRRSWYKDDFLGPTSLKIYCNKNNIFIINSLIFINNPFISNKIGLNAMIYNPIFILKIDI